MAASPGTQAIEFGSASLVDRERKVGRDSIRVCRGSGAALAPASLRRSQPAATASWRDLLSSLADEVAERRQRSELALREEVPNAA